MSEAVKWREDADRLRIVSESWTTEETLQWAFNTYGDEVAVATALGPEGIVLLDIGTKICHRPGVFIIDTGYLFPETLELVERIERRYGIRIERIRASVEEEAQTPANGLKLWQWNPNECCRIRKIEPLRKKLEGMHAWITAIRRDQTPHRQTAGRVQWDTRFGLVKVNPLVDWTAEMVWAYIRSHHLDYNPLHDRNYPSIGCVHCTRPVCQSESERAGRWPGFAKLECGLHGAD